MNTRRKITKTERFLLAFTALFLCVLLVISAQDREEIRQAGIETDRSVPQETFLPDITPLDLNTADAEELDELPGIGEVLAQRILAYREEHGDFNSVDELLEISGIGEKKLADLKNRVTVNGGSADENSGSG